MTTPNMLSDEYRLLRRLGRGGMGEVWEAVRIKSADIVVPCAIKLLHPDFTETARERKLFMDEARIATQLDHGRIVKIIDVGTARDGRPFLVMERVDGVDLRSFIATMKDESEGLLDLDVVVYIVGEVLAALAYAHGRTVGGSDGGVVHSDVTPGNILISSSGEVKLTDFGIARFAATAGPMSQAVGTPRYMSPEQMSGDPRRETDVYGLGVVLHELLEGKRFLEECSPDQLRGRVLMGPPPKLTRQGVPAWLDELRERMIATDAKRRPRADQARAILVEHCQGYVAAGVRLEALYARLIGSQRSGMTALLQPALDESGGVAPTQLLPATVTGPTSSKRTAPVSAPGPITPPPRNLRWLAIGSGALALVLGLALFVQLLQIGREPKAAEGSVAADPPPTATPVSQPTTPEPAPTVDEPKPVQEPPSAPEPDKPLEPEVAPVPESQVQDPPESTQAPKPKPKPKPSVAKVGVVFVTEMALDGQLRVGQKIIVVKNRSAYAELTPGKYKVSWQPASGGDWQLQGQVTIEDIAPSRYKVRLDDGKIVEVGKL